MRDLRKESAERLALTDWWLTAATSIPLSWASCPSAMVLLSVLIRLSRCPLKLHGPPHHWIDVIFKIVALILFGGVTARRALRRCEAPQGALLDSRAQ